MYRRGEKNSSTFGADQTGEGFITDDNSSRPGTGDSATTVASAANEELGLICEECEREDAVWRCKKCVEVFCDACLALCHMPSGGQPHEHHRKQFIRYVKKGDTSSVYQRVEDPPEDRGTSEEEIQAVYTMLLPPTPRETPPRKSQFRRGEYVIFIEPWGRRQAYGRVLAVPNPRDGRSSQIARRGEEVGEMYSVEMIGMLRDLGSKGLEQLLENNDELDKEEGVQLIDDHGRVIQKDLKFAQQQASMTLLSKQRQWESAKQAEQAAEHNDEMPSLNVCVLPVTHLFLPADKHLMLGSDKFLPFRAYLEAHAVNIERIAQARALEIWQATTKAIRKAEELRAALRIQTRTRMWLCRNILPTLKAAREERIRAKWQQVHADFRYVKDHGGKNPGYTSDGRRFFEIQKDLNNYHFRVQKACSALSRQLWRNAMVGFRVYFKHWRAVTSVFTETMIVGSHFNRETNVRHDGAGPDDSELPEYPSAHTPHNGKLENILTDTKTQLPRLPNTHVQPTPFGELIPLRAPSFNSFQARMKGPTDHSFWVLPSFVCAGPYPAGNAVRRKSQLLIRHHQEAISQLMLAGVSTFVCLVTAEEEEEICKAHQIARLDQEVEHKHNMAKGALKSLLSEYELQIRATETALLRMEEYAYEEDVRYKDIVEKKRLALLARMRELEKVEQSLTKAAHNYPTSVHVVRKPIPPNGVLPTHEMLLLLRELEQRMMQGERLYVCSNAGHGRAGMLAACLLGRTYGLPAHDALHRIQLYHDCSSISREASLKQTCPQTTQQRTAVEEVLSRSAVVPSGVIYRTQTQANALKEEWVVPVFGQSAAPSLAVKASGSRQHCALPKLLN